MIDRLEKLRFHLQTTSLVFEHWVPLHDRAEYLFTYAMGRVVLDPRQPDLEREDVAVLLKMAKEVAGEGTDRWALEGALMSLQMRDGMQAEGNFMCCEHCAHNEMGESGEPYVFWHHQADTEAFTGDNLTDTLYVCHSDEEAAEALVAEINTNTRFLAEWDGDDERCVEVYPAALKELNKLELSHE